METKQEEQFKPKFTNWGETFYRMIVLELLMKANGVDVTWWVSILCFAISAFASLKVRIK